MNTVVVYESLWGNTAAVARAAAEGLGPQAPPLSTAEATADALTGVELIVAGAPVFGFKLSSDAMRESIRVNPGKAPRPPDLSHPSMSSWLAALPVGSGRSAAFDTQVRGPFGKGAPAISEALERAGFRPLAPPQDFVVKGKFGPLRKGELERARQWGAELAAAMGAET